MHRLLLALALAVAPSAAASAATVAEVRLFEIRRVSSDFSPLDQLSFQVDTDGQGVRLREWLATLARRVPGGFLAQLATLRFGPDDDERRLDRGRRQLAVRLFGDRRPGGALTVAVRLLQDGEAVQEMHREVSPAANRTVIVSGRDFEVSPSRYLSWFREPGGRAAREALYERLRDRSLFLAVGVTVRDAPAAPAPPPALTPPVAPELLELDSPLIDGGTGVVRLSLTLDADGSPAHLEVQETTLPEVVPRVLGIVRGWRFPDAAGGAGALDLRVRAR